MKFLRVVFAAAATAVLLGGGQMAAAAPADDVTGEPGYLDLEWIKIPANAREIHDIDLSSVLLGLAADAQKSGDGDLAAALAMIHSVRVKAFSVTDQDAGEIEKAVAKVAGRLEKEDWARLIYVKSDEETVTVSTKRHQGELVGLMVVVYEPGDEVVFANVVGDLDLAALFELAQTFGGEDLDHLLDGRLPPPPADTPAAPEAD